MRARWSAALGAMVLTLGACGGGDGAAPAFNESAVGSTVGSTARLPLSSDARCADDSDDQRGCPLSDPVPTGATLTDEHMEVRLVGSALVSYTSDDPVNVVANQGLIYLEIDNVGDRTLRISDYEPDLRFDGVFEREGSNLDSCGVVPREGDIEPGSTVTIRFCGYLETGSAIDPTGLRFDLAAPCAFCDADLAIDGDAVDPGWIAAVESSIEALAAAGNGTADELGRGDLDIDRMLRAGDGGPVGGQQPPIDGTDDDDDGTDGGGASGGVITVPVPPSIGELPMTTEEGVGGTGEGPFGDEVTIGDADEPVTEPTVVDDDEAPEPDPAAAGGIELRDDGLGIVNFDASYEETVAALSAVLGPPDEIGTPYVEPAIGTLQYVRWGHLVVNFEGGNALYFVGYELSQGYDVVDDGDGGFEFALLPWEPSAIEAALATSDGLRIGDDAASAAALLDPVYVPVCGTDPAERSVVDGSDTTDQLFDEDGQRGRYVREPLDGVIWAIGAQARPNPLLCDGGGF